MSESGQYIQVKCVISPESVHGLKECSDIFLWFIQAVKCPIWDEEAKPEGR